MRIVIQRVKTAKVEIEGVTVAGIGLGLLVLAGIARTDTGREADYLAGKLSRLRVFPDAAGKMNLSVRDAGAEVLLVPNFTLYGDCRRGARPAFDLAAPPGIAAPLYDYFVAAVRAGIERVQTGVFQTHMRIALVNDGPVTLICDSRGSPSAIVRSAHSPSARDPN